MKGNIYIYMVVMALVTYFVRALPLTLIRKEIKSVFIKSFLYYVPYVTLSVMTFPAIVKATRSPISGLAAFITALVSSWFGAGLFSVATFSCIVVFATEYITSFL